MHKPAHQQARPAGGGEATSGQRRIWLESRVREDSGADGAGFHSVLLFQLPTAFDLPALRRALAALTARHEALRTTFQFTGDELTQLVQPAFEPDLSVEEIGPWDPARYPLNDGHLAFFREPFDLESGPVFRSRVFSAESGNPTLMIVMHHICTDGWSMGVVQHDLAKLYTAELEQQAADLPQIGSTLTELATQAAGPEGTAARRDSLMYWKDELAGAPAVLELPLARPRPAVRAHHGDRVLLAIPDAVRDRAREVARAVDSTDFVVYLSALQIALSRWCGQDDVIVGTILADRFEPGSEHLVGPLLNMVPLRARIDETSSFNELLRANRGIVLESLAHVGLSFDELVRDLAPERLPGCSPLVQAVFNDIRDVDRLGTSPLGTRLPFDHAESTHYDFVAELEENTGQTFLSLSFATDVLDLAAVEALGARYLSQLEQLCLRPDAPLLTHPTVSMAERTRLLDLGTGPVPAPTPGFLARVRESAARYPDRPAVIAADGRLTYRELLDRAHTLAQVLRSAGAGPESPVGVHLPRSADLAVALVAVLEAGAAYVPLDPDYPSDRLRFIAEDAGLALLVSRAPETGVPWAPSCMVVPPGARGAVSSTSAKSVVSLSTPPGDALAYTIYTSGTTGRPKGVQIPHCGLGHLVDWYVRTYGLTHEDRVPQLAGVSFDASILEMAPALAAGACLAVVPDEVRVDPSALGRFLDETAVTVAFLVTPVLMALEATGAELPRRIRMVQVGGDELSAVPTGASYQLSNLYGPTEASVVSTSGTQHDDAVVTLGGPLPGYRLYLVDELLRLVPEGTPGELCIAGVGVARGYAGRPGLTAARFVSDPFAADGSRMYRTGDRMQWDTDGHLLFRGRTDAQVKIRGFRIEPAEVERVLLDLKEVGAVAVTVRESPASGKQLVGHLVAAPSAARPLDLREIRTALGRVLPQHMVPSALVELAELPLTRNGKVDRVALARHEPLTPLPGEDHRAPEGPIAELLAGVWAEVLSVPQLSGRDDFFVLGGHSLLATRVAARMNDHLGISLPLSLYFERSVLQDLADEIEQRLFAAIDASA